MKKVVFEEPVAKASKLKGIYKKRCHDLLRENNIYGLIVEFFYWDPMEYYDDACYTAIKYEDGVIYISEEGIGIDALINPTDVCFTKEEMESGFCDQLEYDEDCKCCDFDEIEDWEPLEDFDVYMNTYWALNEAIVRAINARVDAGL